MIKISIEVGCVPLLKVAVRAQSIERAVGIACTRYPGKEVRVLFPIDPEKFFDSEKSCLHGEVKPVVGVGGSNEMGQGWSVGTEAIG